MTKHVIKCARSPFAAAWDGKKPFEVRFNDRDYVAGDIVEMHEVDVDGYATGRILMGTISHVLFPQASFGGLHTGYVVLGLPKLVQTKQNRFAANQRLRMSENGERKPVAVE